MTQVKLIYFSKKKSIAHFTKFDSFSKIWTSSESSHFVRGIAHETQIVRRGNSREGLQSTHEAHLGLGNLGFITIFATTLSIFLSEGSILPKLPFWFQAFGARRAVGQRNSDMHYFQFMKFCMEYCRLAELNSSLVGDQKNVWKYTKEKFDQLDSLSSIYDYFVKPIYFLNLKLAHNCHHLVILGHLDIPLLKSIQFYDF